MPASFRHEERVIYIPPEGPSYLLHAPPWRAVLSEEGFGTPPIEYVTDRAPFQHGDVVRSFYLGPRTVQLIVLHNFCSRADYWQGREDFLKVVRPRFYHTPPAPGKLLYFLSGKKKRVLDVFLESGPGFTPPEGGWREWTFIEAIRFIAHDPTWYDPDKHSKTLLYHEPALNLIFPITFPIVFDETAGIATFVIYEGSWLDYPTLEVIGPVTGWSLTNLITGYKLGFTQAVPDGVTVTINLSGIKTVIDNLGNNWAQYLTADSDLSSFALIPDPGAPGGRNDMALAGTGTDPQSRVIVHWYSRYFGI